MAEDRMLSDEILLGLIKANSGGGGGGTSNYNDLSNKPQIGGVTLSGNKSASDLGLVAAETGKGLSTNDYTNEDKAIVGGVTAALADKVDKVEGKGLSTNDFTDAYKTAIGDNTTAISGIKNGASINSFGGVETALADKADKSAVKSEFIGTTAEWNALTTAQKKEYDTYQITDDYTEGSGGLPDYSTTEQLTGQKWIDGKDVYVKTIEFGALPSSTQKDVSSGLSGVNIIKMEAVATSNDDTLLVPYNAANNFIGLLYVYSTNSVRIWANTDLSNHNAVVTIYYTKTA